jgi:hypothetical protein
MTRPPQRELALEAIGPEATGLVALFGRGS